jgi:hypothetical protein
MCIELPITRVRFPMETPNPNNEPTPQDSHDAELRVSGLTGFTPDAARAYLDFHTGMRWLRPKDS